MKNDESAAAIPVDDNTPALIDRMTCADLFDWTGKIGINYLRFLPTCHKLKTLSDHIDRRAFNFSGSKLIGFLFLLLPVVPERMLFRLHKAAVTVDGTGA